MNRREEEKYLKKTIEFQGRLLVLMHMTGGQPARGPEILSLHHRNTAKGLRNVFIEQYERQNGERESDVVFVT